MYNKQVVNLHQFVPSNKIQQLPIQKDRPPFKTPIGPIINPGIRLVQKENQDKENQHSPRSNSSIRHNIQDSIKNELQEQMEMFKKQLSSEYDSQIREMGAQNEVLGNNIEKIKNDLTLHDDYLKEINENLEKLDQELNSFQNEQQKIKNEDYDLTNKVQQDISDKYIDKLKIIQKSQEQTTITLNNIKNQINNEISQQFGNMKDEIKAKYQKQDQKILEYVNEMKEEWEQRVLKVFNQMQSKIENFENLLQGLKQENQQDKIKEIESKMFSELDQYVQQIETQLLQIQVLIDSKLDKSDLPEVIEGYKNLQNSECLKDIQVKVHDLQENLSVNIKNNEKSLTDFSTRMRSFDTFVQNVIKEFEKKIKITTEKFQEISKDKKLDICQKIEQFDTNIKILTEQFIQIDKQIEKNEQNLKQIKEEGEGRFQEIIQTIENSQRQLLNLDKENRQTNDNYIQSNDSNYKQFEFQLQQLVVQINQLQQQLQQSSQQFEEKLAKESINMQNEMDQFFNQNTKKINKNNTDFNQQDNQFDEYLQKYENFNQEVNSYYNNNSIVNTVSQQKNINTQSIIPISQTMQQEQTSIDLNQFPVYQVQNLEQQNMRLSAISEREEEEVQEDEVVYQLDDYGYLLDDKGQQVIDNNGQPIQLSKEHIEYLKTQKMLQDDNK